MANDVRNERTTSSQVSEMGRDTMKNLTEHAGKTMSQAADYLNEAKSRVINARDVVVDRSKEAARVTNDYVTTNPWQAVGIGAGIGLLVGMLIARNR